MLQITTLIMLIAIILRVIGMVKFSNSIANIIIGNKNKLKIITK